jgi:hypothetical protein
LGKDEQGLSGTIEDDEGSETKGWWKRMAWLIVGDSYINLDAVSKVRVTEQESVIEITFYRVDGMILEQVRLPKQALQHFYQVMSYLTKAIPVGMIELPTVKGEKE